MFLPIPNYTDYKINAFGDVIDIDGKFLSKHLTYNGYHRVWLKRNNIKKRKRVHCLVLETFIGPRPKGKQCNHKDGNKLNNHVSNLEWVTPKENHRHARQMGLINHDDNPAFVKQKFKGKFKEGEVWLIKRLLKADIVLQKEIAKMFQVVNSCISKIHTGATYRNT